MKIIMPLKKIPRTTAQQKKIAIINGKPRLYKSKKLESAYLELKQLLCVKRPKEPLDGPISLSVRWCFETSVKKNYGRWKVTRPDCDNLNKMLKDIMTEIGFWKDDSLVVKEHIEKIWTANPRIEITIDSLEDMAAE